MKYPEILKSHGKGWTGGISMYKNFFESSGPWISGYSFQNQNYSAVRRSHLKFGSLHSILKIRTKSPVHGSLYSHLKIRTNLTVRESLHFLFKIRPKSLVRRSLHPFSKIRIKSAAFVFHFYKTRGFSNTKVRARMTPYFC